jgi:anti-anti-sigma factor
MPAPSPPSGPLSCQVTRDGHRAVIAVRGEVDLATAPLLASSLDAVRGDGATELLVDLSGVTFMDSTGLRLLIVWSDAARQDGFSLRVSVAPGSMPRRLFELAGVLSILQIVDGDGGGGTDGIGADGEARVM